jgi:hypothetical protein
MVALNKKSYFLNFNCKNMKIENLEILKEGWIGMKEDWKSDLWRFLFSLSGLSCLVMGQKLEYLLRSNHKTNG